LKIILSIYYTIRFLGLIWFALISYNVVVSPTPLRLTGVVRALVSS